MPNGTIMLSIGLLSIIDSEEELVSILAHEVAHFVDHYVMNIIKQQEREKRAAFWAVVLLRPWLRLVMFI